MRSRGHGLTWVPANRCRNCIFCAASADEVHGWPVGPFEVDGIIYDMEMAGQEESVDIQPMITLKEEHYHYTDSSQAAAAESMEECRVLHWEWADLEWTPDESP